MYYCKCYWFKDMDVKNRSSHELDGLVFVCSSLFFV